MMTRKMRVEDLSAILPIQAQCYYDIVPESAACLQAKIIASPDTCFVCCDADGHVAGYIISIPIMRHRPPVLDVSTCVLPENANCLYLHDMAVSPEFRGQNVGQLLYAAIKHAFHDLQFEYASLIAIQRSQTYWQKHGFKIVETNGALALNLASYGEQAKYMELYKPRVISCMR